MPFEPNIPANAQFARSREFTPTPRPVVGANAKKGHGVLTRIGIVTGMTVAILAGLGAFGALMGPPTLTHLEVTQTVKDAVFCTTMNNEAHVCDFVGNETAPAGEIVLRLSSSNGDCLAEVKETEMSSGDTFRVWRRLPGSCADVTRRVAN